jgi:hypothetical protein
MSLTLPLLPAVALPHTAVLRRGSGTPAARTRGPGTPGACAWAGPPPDLPAPASHFACPAVILPVPRLDPATALPCVVTTHRRRGVAHVTSKPFRAFDRTRPGHTPHTSARTHTDPHGPEPHRIWPPHQIRWETDKRAPPVGGSEGRCPLGVLASTWWFWKVCIGPRVWNAGKARVRSWKELYIYIYVCVCVYVVAHA